MWRTLAHAVLIASVAGPAALAQDPIGGDSESKIELPNGIHLYGATVYSGYMTSAYPATGIVLNLSSPVAALGPDEMYGGEVRLGWQHHLGRTDFSAVYSGGYSGMVHYSGVNGVNQTLDLDLKRALSAKWGLSISGGATDSTMAQYLFRPDQFSGITQAPLTFQDFAAALGVGQFSNAQIASLLTGAPVLQSPAQSLLYGERILSYSGQAALSYAYSSRLNFHLSGFTAAGQNRLGTTVPGVPADYVLPHSTGANAGVGFTYMISPRTNLGLDGGEFMLWNRYQKVRGTTGSVSVGRKMSEHWFVRSYGGLSEMQMLQAGASQPALRTVIGGASLGVKSYSHRLAISYDRSSYDSFGFAAGVVTSEAGSWTWKRPGNRWSAFAGFDEQQLRDTGFASLSGWRATGGISIQMRQQMSMQVEYAHLRMAGIYTGVYNQFEVDSIRVSLGWVPVWFAH